MKTTTLALMSLLSLTHLGSQANESIRFQGFSQWILEELEDAPISTHLLDAQADPDRDGLSNLMEYALDSDPLHPSDRDLPKPEFSRQTMSLTFTVDRSKTDIIHRAEFSTDLRHWEPAGTETLTSKGSLERRRATIALTGDPAYLRLAVRPAHLD